MIVNAWSSPTMATDVLSGVSPVSSLEPIVSPKAIRACLISSSKEPARGEGRRRRRRKEKKRWASDFLCCLLSLTARLIANNQCFTYLSFSHTYAHHLTSLSLSLSLVCSIINLSHLSLFTHNELTHTSLSSQIICIEREEAHTCFKFLIFLLKICSGRLSTGTNGLCSVFVVIARGTGLKQMGSSLLQRERNNTYYSSKKQRVILKKESSSERSWWKAQIFVAYDG